MKGSQEAWAKIQPRKQDPIRMENPTIRRLVQASKGKKMKKKDVFLFTHQHNNFAKSVLCSACFGQWELAYTLYI